MHGKEKSIEKEKIVLQSIELFNTYQMLYGCNILTWIFLNMLLLIKQNNLFTVTPKSTKFPKWL